MEQNRIEELKKKKMSKFYPVKGQNFNSVKQVDFNKRTVQFIGNTYYYVDSDYDILIDGAARKTIADRGPQSRANAKIKHLADHKMSVDKMVGKPLLIEETQMDGKTVIYCESEVFETPAGDEHLVKYQTGGYDQHSIGFRYVDIEYAEKDSENSDARGYWDEFFPQLLNPEVAEKVGFFWVVKEIELFEISVVTFGANSLTPVVGVKSKDKQTMAFELSTRLNTLEKQFTDEIKTGKKGKEFAKVINLQILQIKQVIDDLLNDQPSLKDTGKQPSTDTGKDIDYDFLLKSINNNK